MRKIKIGQIGVGHNHGEAKMLAVRRLYNDFEVVGYAEPDEEWFAKRGNLPCYDGIPLMTVEELLAIPDLEAVMVEPAVPDLMKIARLCIDRGVHIHLDKHTNILVKRKFVVLKEIWVHYQILQNYYQKMILMSTNLQPTLPFLYLFHYFDAFLILLQHYLLYYIFLSYLPAILY